MRVLVNCERSGIVRDAFLRHGHDAWSCDLAPASGPHYQCDARDVLGYGWDLMIYHAPCTYLCNSGVRWLYEQPGRWKKMEEGALFFKELMEAPIPKKCGENPIPHKYALRIIGRKYNQIIQPWMFGHGETKATCFWLERLPKLVPTCIVEGREHRIHRMPPSEDRGILRSTTYPGVADAMAEQWGGEVEYQMTFFDGVV